MAGNDIIWECSQTAATYLRCACIPTVSGRHPLEKYCRAERVSDGKVAFPQPLWTEFSGTTGDYSREPACFNVAVGAKLSCDWNPSFFLHIWFCLTLGENLFDKLLYIYKCSKLLQWSHLYIWLQYYSFFTTHPAKTSIGFPRCGSFPSPALAHSHSECHWLQPAPACLLPARGPAGPPQKNAFWDQG